MYRLLTCLLICLVGFYTGGGPALALCDTAAAYASHSVLTEEPPTSTSVSSTTGMPTQATSTTTATTTTATQTVDDNTTNVINTELFKFDTNSSTFITWAQTHPYLAAGLVAVAVCGIVAISVAVPVGIHAYHQNHNTATSTSQQNSIAAAYYQNYLRSLEAAPVVRTSAPVTSGGGYVIP